MALAEGLDATAFSPPGAQTDAPTLCFLAGDAQGPPALAGVLITAVTNGGLVDLGSTAEDGALCLEKDAVAALEPFAIILCKENFFCGAFRIDPEETDPGFFDWGEHFIALSRFTIVDYFRAPSPTR